MNSFFIDVPTYAARVTLSRLLHLKTTYLAESKGKYREDPGVTQLYIKTKWTEDQLDHWLYKSKGVDYIGIVQIQGEQS